VLMHLLSQLPCSHQPDHTHLHTPQAPPARASTPLRRCFQALTRTHTAAWQRGPRGAHAEATHGPCDMGRALLSRLAPVEWSDGCSEEAGSARALHQRRCVAAPHASKQQAVQLLKLRCNTGGCVCAVHVMRRWSRLEATPTNALHPAMTATHSRLRECCARDAKLRQRHAHMQGVQVNHGAMHGKRHTGMRCAADTIQYC
jgi:hypothetical protein